MYKILSDFDSMQFIKMIVKQKFSSNSNDTLTKMTSMTFICPVQNTNITLTKWEKSNPFTITFAILSQWCPIREITVLHSYLFLNNCPARVTWLSVGYKRLQRKRYNYILPFNKLIQIKSNTMLYLPTLPLPLYIVQNLRHVQST